MLKFNVYDVDSKRFKGTLVGWVLGELIYKNYVDKVMVKDRDAFKIVRGCAYGTSVVELVLNVGDVITLAD